MKGAGKALAAGFTGDAAAGAGGPAAGGAFGAGAGVAVCAGVSGLKANAPRPSANAASRGEDKRMEQWMKRTAGVEKAESGGSGGGPVAGGAVAPALDTRHSHSTLSPRA